MLRSSLRSHWRWASHPVKAAAKMKPMMYPPVGPAITLLARRQVAEHRQSDDAEHRVEHHGERTTHGTEAHTDEEYRERLHRDGHRPQGNRDLRGDRRERGASGDEHEVDDDRAAEDSVCDGRASDGELMVTVSRLSGWPLAPLLSPTT